ncbi:MAG: hypothetical protein ACFFEJ_18135, partial [Candidatus Thorarchaeota archaeon]
MPFREFTDIIGKILELYDACDYESAAILSRTEASRATDPILSLLLNALDSHLQGQTRWESSYDYAMARDHLKHADVSIKKGIDSCEGSEQSIFKALNSLNGVVEAAISLENALISTDARLMTEISEILVELATEGLIIIKEMNDGESEIAEWFDTQLKAWQLYGNGVSAYSKAMDSLRTDGFSEIFDEAQKTISECLLQLEEDGDEDTYTELASYLEFLKHHARITEESPEQLIMKDNQMTWLFSFWGEQEYLNKVYDLLLADTKSLIEEMAAHGITVETVDEDTLSDLFETVLGEERMKDLVFTLKPLTLSFRGQDIDIRISVRIYRYGISTIYLETEVDELSVSDLRVLLSFSGPHSAEYDITWEGRTYLRLNALAEDIVSTLNKVFPLFEPQCALRFVPHLNWYAYVLIRRGLYTRDPAEDRQVSLEEASKLPDYKGLLLGQMEARAALDDWVLREPIGIRNLAPIRSHITDLLVTTENHGVLAFPDDPRWIIIQYQETIETAVRLRCLISTLIEIAGEILDSFVEETSDLAQELDNLDLEVAEIRITETRRSLLPVIHFDTLAHMNIELIRGTLTSNYRDHAELMRAMMDDLNVDRMVSYLERRLGILSHHQTLFSDIASGVVEKREKLAEKKQEELDKRRTQAMELVEVFISVLAIGEVLGIMFNAIRSLSIDIDPILESMTYFISMLLMFAIIFYIRRGGFR